jgi:hypothetical protein
VPRVADLACVGLADRFVASWTPVAGIDRYFLQIRKDDQDAFSSYLQGQESGFEWTATGPGVYEVVLTPNDAAGLTGLVSTCSSVVFPQRAFLRADCNGDGDVDISDPISLLGYLFLGSSAVGCADACDANDDNALDISDSIQALNYMFLGGPAPAPPFGSCGEDPEGLMLGCLQSACP